MLKSLMSAARSIRDERYGDAAVVLAAGALMRGQGTAYSDLDLVVIYERLPVAYRESFRFQGLPVEAFVHDPETLCFVCGPESMVDAVPPILGKLGIAAKRIRLEEW